MTENSFYVQQVSNLILRRTLRSFKLSAYIGLLSAKSFRTHSGASEK